ncbi:TPA: hypothetical protein ACH3X1_015077 [Trebouxia sp. C0004]
MLASKQLNSLPVTIRRCGPVQLGLSRTCSKSSKGTFRCQAQGQRQVRRDAMQERQRNKNEKLRVLGLISACVESNAITQKFEELAGRSAMVSCLRCWTMLPAIACCL